MKKKVKTSLVKAPAKKKVAARKVAVNPSSNKKPVAKKALVAKTKKPKAAKRRANRFSLGKLIGLSALIVVSLGTVLSLKPSIDHDVLSASTSTEPPLAPSKLIAKVKNSTVTITWSDTSLFAADKYVVYRYDSASGKYIAAPQNQIAGDDSKKYVSSQNDSGRTYLYKVGGVRLYYAAGESVPIEAAGPLSKPISVKIPVIKAPKKPTKLKATVKNSVISLTWSGSADGYTVEKYDDQTDSYVSEISDGNLSATKFSNATYEPGKQYKLRVGAYNNVYESGEIKDVLTSDYAVITVSVPVAKAPLAPSKLKAATNDGMVKLTWANPSKYKKSGDVTVNTNGIDGYKIMVYDDDSNSWQELNSKYIDFDSETTANITGQNAGETKQYKLMAYKSFYNEDTAKTTNLYGPYSKFVSVTMQ